MTTAMLNEPDWLCDCPRCGSEQIMPEARHDEPFGLRCDDCGWTGPREGWDDAPDGALWAWDEEARKIRAALNLGLTINLGRRIPEATREPSAADAGGRADGVQSHTEETQQYQLVMAPAVGIEPTTN